MSRIHALLAAAALALSDGAAAQAAEYDLAAYLAKVESANPDLALARRDAAAAGQNVIQARSALLPSLGLQGSYARNLKDVEQPAAVASQAGGGPLIYQDVDSNFDNELTMALGVNQKIFDPESIARYEQARKGRVIQAAVLEATRRSVRNAAKKLYTQTQLAAAVVEVAAASERTAEDNYRSVELKYQAGVTTELEMLMAEVDWKTKIPATAEARRNAELAMVALKNLAGIPLSETLVLTEDGERLPEMPAEPGLEEVLAARPDYRAEILSKEIADIARKAAIASFLPSVSGSFSCAYGGFGNGGALRGDNDYTAAQLGLSMTIPLFSGGYRLSLIESARINQEKAVIGISKKRDDVERELVSLRLRMDEARRRIDSARLVETAARRALVLSQTAFSNGVVTQLSVTEAASNLDQARLGLYNALYEYRIAYYDWELATGKAE